MCLIIPKQVLSVNKDVVKLKAGDKIVTAGCLINVKKGDWVLTQQGVIIKKINKREAKEILKMINKHK